MPQFPISVSIQVVDALSAAAPVAMGGSGGKDSCALAIALNEYLNKTGHQGPRILIHSDLGRTEWKASLPTCQRLADRLNLELVIVRREAGDMMDRWLVRWSNNVARWENLECVKVILPWSTATMRFCTSELKTAIICRALIHRFPGQLIISASGIRREESEKRKKAPISSVQSKLTSKTHKTTGLNWHPILEWEKVDVFSYLSAHNFPVHEAYTRYGTSRVSCVYCILASKADLKAATTCVDNHDVYREMVDLEIQSTFSFQDQGWLGEIAPQLLTDAQKAGLEEAKRKALIREEIESEIPKHLLYTKGWPTVLPTYSEAELLAGVRQRVAALMEFSANYLTPGSILERYAELMAENERKKAQKEKKAA
jgi:3'-phosphoadenosine 5'-phosphosulfate sulfotransferase (PAPS reductase)/FAD synthetase